MAEKTDKSGVLAGAAKVIGKAAGKVASLAGAGAEEEGNRPKPASARRAKGKLPKKNKSRLPRRQKKAQRKLQQAR